MDDIRCHQRCWLSCWAGFRNLHFLAAVLNPSCAYVFSRELLKILMPRLSTKGPPHSPFLQTQLLGCLMDHWPLARHPFFLLSFAPGSGDVCSFILGCGRNGLRLREGRGQTLLLSFSSSCSVGPGGGVLQPRPQAQRTCGIFRKQQRGQCG